MPHVTRHAQAVLVGSMILLASALPAAAADRASGTVSVTDADGKALTLEVRHGYFFTTPDPFGGPAHVRVLVFTDKDVHAKIAACDDGRCAEFAAEDALVVKLWSDGSPPSHWTHVGSTQYSGPLSGPGLDLEVDTAERVAGKLEISTSGTRATVSFDVTRIEAFATLD